MAGRKNLNKNAISAFEEYGVQHRQPPKVEIVSTSGPPHKPVYVFILINIIMVNLKVRG